MEYGIGKNYNIEFRSKRGVVFYTATILGEDEKHLLITDRDNIKRFLAKEDIIQAKEVR